MHLCTELTAAFWTLELFGEIGANFSLQLSSQTRYDKINKKKVIAENQCEKHKKIEFIIALSRRLMLVDTCIKFHEYSLSSFQVIERTRFL